MIEFGDNTSEAGSNTIQFKTKFNIEEDREREEQRFMERFAAFLDKKENKKKDTSADNNRKMKDKYGPKNDDKKGKGAGKPGETVNSNEQNKPLNTSNSEVTIYEPAVPMVTGAEIVRAITPVPVNKDIISSEVGILRRDSSSSDDINTSDDIDLSPIDKIAKLIVDTRRDLEKKLKERNGSYVNDGQQPHCSRDYRREEATPEDKAAQIVKQAERAKARILEIPGNRLKELPTVNKNQLGILENGERLHSVLVD